MQLDITLDAASAQQAADAERQELLQQVADLKQRVTDLESNTVLSDPETRVRRVEVFVDENGAEHDEQVPGSKPVVTYRRERVYRRQTINEKIEEALADAEEHSVRIGVDAAITTQFAKRTKGGDPFVDNHAYALASADLFFTAGIAQNTVFFADIVALSGSPPDAEIPSLTLLNGYTARLERQNELNLREVWLRTELFGQRLALTTGRLDLTNYFDANALSNDESTQFLSDALVNNQMLGLAATAPAWPPSSIPKNGFRLKFGLQQSNNDATNLSDSLFTLSEVGYTFTPFALPEGSYRALVPDRQHVAGDAQGRRHQHRPEAHAMPSACSRATERRTWRTTAAITTGARESASRTASSSIRRTPGASATRRWSWSRAIVRSWWRATTTCCSPSGCGCRSICRTRSRRQRVASGSAICCPACGCRRRSRVGPMSGATAMFNAGRRILIGTCIAAGVAAGGRHRPRGSGRQDHRSDVGRHDRQP